MDELNKKQLEIDHCHATCDELRQRVYELKTERGALAAQIEVFRSALEYADNKLYILTHNRDDVSSRLIADADKAFKVVRNTLSQSSTPAACLAQVRAGAVSEFVEWAYDTCPNIDCMLDDSGDYIARIRQEVRNE